VNLVFGTVVSWVVPKEKTKVEQKEAQLVVWMDELMAVKRVEKWVDSTLHTTHSSFQQTSNQK
jgi:hypothetical protein